MSKTTGAYWANSEMDERHEVHIFCPVGRRRKRTDYDQALCGYGDPIDPLYDAAATGRKCRECMRLANEITAMTTGGETDE